MLDRAANDLRAHGITESQANTYRDAVHAVLQNRPSVAGRSGVYFDRLSFSPQAEYFAPEISYAEGTSEILRLLPPGCKPRLGTDEKISSGRVDGRELLAQANAAMRTVVAKHDQRAAVYERTRNTNDVLSMSGPVDAYERFLTSVNRMQYAFHEPIHIFQNYAPGDLANTLRWEFDPDGTLFDEARVRGFVHNELGYRDIADDVAASGTAKMLLRPTAFPRSPETTMSDDAAIGEIIASNEATMDVISERNLRPFLREQPAFCLWLHNQFVTLNETIGAFLEMPSKETDDPTGYRTAVRLSEVYAFVSQSYFTAFESTAEAQRHLAQTTNTFLGRHVGGRMLETPAYTRVDQLNRQAELQLVLNQNKKKNPSPPTAVTSHTFPTGETARFPSDTAEVNGMTIYKYPPLSETGLALGAKAYANGILSGCEPNQLAETFVRFEAALESNEPHAIESAREDLARKTGTPISSGDARSLFGFAAYLPTGTLGPEFPRVFLVRKAVLDLLPTNHPYVTGIHQQLFVDLREMIDATTQYRLLGFTPGHAKPISWEQASTSGSLSVYGFDVPSLPKERTQELNAIYEEVMASPPDWTATKKALRAMAEVKRRIINANETRAA